MAACGETNPDEPNPDPANTNPPYVFPAVVSPDYEKVTVAVCDTAKGQYAIQFKEEVADIKAGSVVIVQDGDAHHIVLVTKASTNGNRVDFSGKLGDLRYVFNNTTFTLRIGEQNENTGGDSVYYPTKSSTRVEKPFTLWDEPYINDFTLWELKEEDYPEWMIQIPTSTEEHADLSAHVEFFPKLVVDLKFEFGAETQDILDDIIFSLAGAYDVTATITGDFHSSLDFTFNYKMDDVWDGIVHGGDKPRYFFDQTELLKHDLFHKDFGFMVGMVPVEIHAGCDLFTEMMMTMHGEAKLTFGVESDMHVMAEAKVSPYRDQILDYDKDFDFDWDGHEPVFSGQESVDLKWYLYPHFYFWIDFGAGPCVDIKPYARVDFGHGGQKNFSEWQSYDDFYTWTTKGYVGLDWAVGISSPLENYFYEADAVTKDLGNIDEWEFLKSPAGLILESEPGEIKAGEPTTFNFKVLGEFYGKPATTWFPTFIKLDFPKNGKIETLFPILGKAKYTWTPVFEGDEMVARVFDLDGTVLGQQVFRAGAGNSIRVLTGEATDITKSSAVINSVYEANIPVLKTGIVYSSSVDVPVIGEAGCIDKPSTETASPFTIQINNLKSMTRYNYRAYAVINGDDSNENVVYGSRQSFITLGDGNGGVVVDIPGENL